MPNQNFLAELINEINRVCTDYKIDIPDEIWMLTSYKGLPKFSYNQNLSVSVQLELINIFKNMLAGVTGYIGSF